MNDRRTDDIAREAARLLETSRAESIGEAIRAAAERLGHHDADLPGHGRVRKHAQAISTQRRPLLVVAAVLAFSSVARADLIFVDVDACPGPGSGTEVDPYCSIQDAVDAAVDGDEIVVASGTYFETINFLGKGIALRSSEGPELTIIDGTGFFHVVQCVNGEGPDTVLDGFTITGGDADGLGLLDSAGGGMLNDNSSPTVTNCTLTENSAGSGGGMYNARFSSPTVTKCTFRENTALFSGGGMGNMQANPTLINCSFEANEAHIGGGMFNNFSGPTVTNCTFTENTYDFGGGGMFNIQASHPIVTNCTFSGNSALGIGGAGGGMLTTGFSTATVANCILWGNSPDEISGSGAPAITIIYSDVQGGWPGIGNIDAGPLFVDPGNGDFRLSAGSPAIDAGDNGAVPEDVTTDLDGNPRFVDDGCTADRGSGEAPVVDMGAYEFQGSSCDLDADGVVGILDLLLLLAAWGPCADCGSCPADFNADCNVGVTDMLILLGNWG